MVLRPKPVPPLVPIALKLKQLGYRPLPLRSGKSTPNKGWKLEAATEDEIRKWTGHTVAVWMQASDDLFAIDLDVQDQSVLDAIIDRYVARWPCFMKRCVIRHSGRVKCMLIGRLSTDKKHMATGRYGADVIPGGNRIELFTSNDPGYIAVWGVHSEGRDYGYDGPALHEVPLAELPEFLDADLNELLAIATEEMEAAGLKMTEAATSDKADILYDLTPDMEAELKDGRRMTLEELAVEAEDEFVYIHGRLFDPDSDSYRIKCKVTPRGLTLWDFGNGVQTHYWKHLGPQPEVLAPLLHQLAQAEAARTTAGGDATIFGAMGPGTLTQDGVALVFAERLANKLKYCHATGLWYYWTGVYWMPERTRLAFQYCRELGRELSEHSVRTEMKEVRKVAFAGGVEKFAQADRRMATTAECWDEDPYLLGTPGGTLDLRTGIVRPAQQKDCITKLTACTPAPAGTFAPMWMKFLKETFKGDRKLIDFAQVWFGYCLTGDVSEHALWFGFGEGGNGKGVLINTITKIFKDYAVVASMDTFVASKHDRHLTEIAMLRGARLVTASETEKGRAWAESRLKQLTGGDPITARFMRQDNFTFQPQFKLALMGNHKPVLRGVDDAVRRRFNMVPFLFKPELVDRKLEAKLKAEWPAILAWMVEGCLIWQREGLIKPDTVKTATEGYFAEQDITGQWLAECCDVRPGAAIFESTAALFVSWKHFAETAGEWPGNRKTFATELSRRGFEQFQHGHDKVRSLRGIKLKNTKIAKAILNIVANELDDPEKKEE